MAGATIFNPHEGTELAGGWTMGFSWGFTGPGFSSEPPIVIAPELVDVFNEGVLAGQQAAIEGLNVGIECVSLEPDASSAAEPLLHEFHVAEGAGIAVSLVKRHFAMAGIEVLFLAFQFMIPGPPPLDPVSEFNQQASNVQGQLEALGLASGALFLGAGVDEAMAGCGLLFVPVFRNVDQAREALISLGRPSWILAEWNASLPQSGGGFRVIEAA